MGRQANTPPLNLPATVAVEDDPGVGAGRTWVLAFGLAAALGGCAGSNGVSSLSALLTALPPPAATTTATAAPTAGAAGLSTFASTPTVKGSPTEVYERVARGALTCWFGGLGPLKKTHIFNAEAAPPSSGGAAEISVHERDPSQPSPRGSRVFRIWLTKESDETTRMTLQVAKLPQDLAQAMEKDALAWGRGQDSVGKDSVGQDSVGKDSCEAQIVRPPPPPPQPEPVKGKPKKRVVQAVTR